MQQLLPACVIYHKIVVTDRGYNLQRYKVKYDENCYIQFNVHTHKVLWMLIMLHIYVCLYISDLWSMSGITIDADGVEIERQFDIDWNDLQDPLGM